MGGGPVMCYVGNLAGMITKRLKGLSILSLNNTVLRCLLERKKNLGSIPSCHFLDFIDFELEFVILLL